MLTPRFVFVVAGAALLVVAPAVAGPRRNLAPGVAREDDRLVLEAPGGDVTVDVQGWVPFPDPNADVLPLVRRNGPYHEIRVLDRRGNTLGQVTAPDGWIARATDGGIVLVPAVDHAFVKPHALRFLSFAGELRREVTEPTLALFETRIMRGGRFVTVSATGADDREFTVLAYDASGMELWRHVVRGFPPPEALVTADGRRLVVLERDVDTRLSKVTVFRAGHRPKTHHLPLVADMVADPGSARVAVVGKRIVAVIDAESRKLKWRRDDPIDVPLRGGVRFDRRAPRLFVVGAEPDAKTKRARLRLRTYRLSDGAGEAGDLGDTPDDRLPAVADVDVAPEGRRRVLLHDRAVTAEREEPLP